MSKEEHPYVSDPYTCKECGADLFPDFMSGEFIHFEKGCQYSNMGCVSIKGRPRSEPDFIGVRRSQLIAAGI